MGVRLRIELSVSRGRHCVDGIYIITCYDEYVVDGFGVKQTETDNLIVEDEMYHFNPSV